MTLDDSLSTIEPDLESIYSEFKSSVDNIETNITDDESNLMYVSSGISIKLPDEQPYEDNDEEEFDDRELAVIIEVQKRSTNYTDTFIRKIYKKRHAISRKLLMCLLPYLHLLLF